MAVSSMEAVTSFMQKWRITTFDRIWDRAFGTNPPKTSLQKILQRLRKRRLLFSTRIGNDWYHFDRIFKRRHEALEKLSNIEKTQRFYQWGIKHHLQVIDLGHRLETQFPNVAITANLFSDHVSFSTGSLSAEGKKFAPDLTVASKVLDQHHALYIEVERTLKSERRYEERWLAYESDTLLQGCLYCMDDPLLAERLCRFMDRYFKGGKARSDFFLACGLTSNLDQQIHIFSSTERSTTTLAQIMGNLERA